MEKIVPNLECKVIKKDENEYYTDMPENSDEFKERLTLKNDEVSIEKIDFSLFKDCIELEEFDADMPESSDKFKKRLFLWLKNKSNIVLFKS